MVRPGMFPGRGVRAVAVLAIGAAAVIAVAVVMSGRPAPGGHPASPAGQSGASRAPARPAAVSLAASHVSPAETPVKMALHGTLAAGAGPASLKYGGTYLWDTVTGKVIAIVRDPGRSGSIGPIAFSPDGTTLAEVGVGTIYLWDIAARKFIATLPIPRGLDVTTLALSPDGKALALVTGERLSTVYLWDIAAGKVTATFANPSDYGVSCVAFAPGGTTVAVGQDTGAILLWDTRTGKVTGGPFRSQERQRPVGRGDRVRPRRHPGRGWLLQRRHDVPVGRHRDAHRGRHRPGPAHRRAWRGPRALVQPRRHHLDHRRRQRRHLPVADHQVAPRPAPTAGGSPSAALDDHPAHGPRPIRTGTPDTQ